MEDTDIIQLIAQGNEQALTTFYQRYEARLFRFIRSKLPDYTEAADIVNEVFLEVWQKAASFQQKSKVSTWLFSIAYFKSVDHLRKHRPEQLLDEHVGSLEDESPTAASCLMTAQQSEQIKYCMGTLKPDHQAVMQLTFFEDMSYKDIAVIVQCPENTVKTRMFHAKQVMKKCLSRLFGGSADND